MNLKRPAAISLVPVLVLMALFLSGLLPVQDPRFRPSGWSAYVPEDGEPFTRYIDENRRRIRQALQNIYFVGQELPFGPDYPLDRVVAMRSPYEITPDPDRCDADTGLPRRGFLMIHGLTDSPYLLSDLSASLSGRFPCARIRGLLMPGHGTVPGDLLDVTLEDWQQAVRYGVQAFDGLVDSLYLVGYSNGAALAVDYLQDSPPQVPIDGLILLSPGLAAARDSIALTPYLKYVLRWVSKGEDRDAAKYDSMPTSAAAVFYRLTERVARPGGGALQVPVFAVVSGDDSTVNPEFAADYFCQRLNGPGSRLLWYRSPVTGSSPVTRCAGLQVVDVAVEEARFLSHSHVAISMPPENVHYGLDGNYAVCSAYSDSPALLEQCSSDNINTVYGENSLREENLLFEGRVVRRATFNPLYRQLVEELACFVDQSCSD